MEVRRPLAYHRAVTESESKGPAIAPSSTTAQPAVTEGVAPTAMLGSAGGRLLQRKIARRAMQRAASGGGGAAAGDPAAAVERAASSSGSPLPVELQSRFGASLGTDLGQVRVHTGSDSVAASEAVSARAYTTGQDIHFNRG